MLAIRAHGDEEGVEGHGGIDGDFAAELVLDLAFFYGVWAVVFDDLGEVWQELVVGGEETVGIMAYV